MGRFFNLDSPVMVFLSKMADLMILNLLTLLLCIPIITAGDAITALYYMTIKIVKGEEGYIVRGYFKSFKENFKQATLIWLMVLVLGIVLIGDFMILSNSNMSFEQVLTVLIMIVTVLYVFTVVYVFPVLSRFENTIKNTIRNSFLMSIMSLPRTVLIIIINVLPIVLLLLIPQAMPFLIMFGFSVPAYLCSRQFVKIFKKFEPEEEEEGNSEELETLSFIREEEEEKRRALEAERQKAEKREAGSPDEEEESTEEEAADPEDALQEAAEEASEPEENA